MSEKILLVDDDADVRQEMKRLIAKLGYTVFVARDSEDALKMSKEIQPSIVLTDFDMLGVEYGERVRTFKTASPDAEVMIMAGNQTMDTALKCLKHEAAEFIPKPVNKDILEIALQRIRDRIVMRDQLRAYAENMDGMVREESARRIQTERLLTVKQIVGQMSGFIGQIANDVEGGVKYFNEMPYFVSIHTPDLKVVAQNQSYRKHFGCKIGHDSWKIYSGTSASRDQCPVGKAIQTKHIQKSHASVKYRSGTEVPVFVHAAPILDFEGNVSLVLEVSAGIKEIKHLREELKTSQQRYQQLFDEVPCYIAVLNKKFRVTDINRRFKEDFGDEIGNNFFDIFKRATEPCASCSCPIEETVRDGAPHESEMILTARNGKRYSTLLWTAPIKTASGMLSQILVIFADVTQLRKLQDNLSSIGLMIGSISHGIKGVLTGLDASLYLIDAGFYKDRPGQIEEGLEVSKLMVERIKKLVLDILYYAKERKLRREPVDALWFVCDIAADVDTKMRGANINFVSDFDRCPGEFEIDAEVVRPAIVNILENAMEACIEDPAEKSHKIIFAMRKDADHILFDIIDNGIGIEQEGIKDMFTMFYSSKGHKGTGLGLFIADKVIREHGGRIEVDSTPGEGTHFTVIVPRKRPQAPAPASTPKSDLNSVQP